MCRWLLPVAGWAAVLLLTLSHGVTWAEDYTEDRSACLDRNPLNNLYWGDLHVHTRYSLDAATQDTRTTPTEAYEFARGAEVGLQPWHGDQPQRRLKLAQPLDFAAVTDHAELLGEVTICGDASLEGYDSLYCSAYRRFPRLAFFLFNYRASTGQRLGLCGADGERCRQAAAGPWRVMQEAAEAAYDRSENCRFTSFVAYEWTGASKTLANTHRNVIFRNATVPALPVSFIDSKKQAEILYEQLDAECLDADGACDVLVIPHNSNLSDGAMFPLHNADGSPLTAEQSRTRQRFEPLFELLQHKGSSECFFQAGVSEDELCAFEQLPYNTFTGKFQFWAQQPPTADDGFARQVLRDGLGQQAASGSNPFQFGFVGSTDTHLGTPGAVSEAGYPGHGGAGAPADGKLPAGLADDLEFNPGGLAAVWATENSRDALFDAMRRRETYASSGPRIELRLFAGENIPTDLCQQRDFVADGYAAGEPMGAELIAGERLRLAVSARRDPQSLPLQRLQVIKGWIDEKGHGHEQVLDVAGDADNGAGVDLSSCATHGEGFELLCRVWEDPAFDARQHAYYYARAVENPSCRWSQHQCAARGVDCSRPETVTPELEACCSVAHRPVIHERAVSSPVWLLPGDK